MIAPLPPVAWLRERNWGRDITAYARGQFDRIQDSDDVLRRSNSEDSAISLMVNFGAYRDIGLTTSNVTPEKAFDVTRASGHETEIAEMLVEFISDGSRYHALGSDLVAATLEGPSPTVSSVMGTDRSFYVRYEGLNLIGPDGGAIDGFMVDRNAEGDPAYLSFIPMGAKLPESGHAINPNPTVELEIDNSDRSLAEAIGDAARDIADLADTYGSKFDEIVDTITEVDADGAALKNAKSLRKQTEERFETMVIDAFRKSVPEHVTQMRQHSEWLIANAETCAKMLAMAIACVDGWGPEAKPSYDESAPEEDVAKALGTGSGSRKAGQRLAQKGYPRILRHEIGEAQEALPVLDRPDPRKTKAAANAERSNEIVERTAPKRNPNRRKEKRLQNRREIVIEKKPVVTKTTAAAPAHCATQDGEDVPVAAAAKTIEPQTDDVGTAGGHIPLGQNEGLAELVGETIRRTLRDMPPMTGRNWEIAFPSALAALLMRRVTVDRNPRETDDATRKRLAADILPRLEGLPDHLARLRAEEDANPGLRRYARITRPLVERELDTYVTDEAVHPVVVVVDGDDRLADMLRFPGTAAGEWTYAERVIMVRAWKEDTVLHLDGILYEGCLSGFLRINHDLVSGESTLVDGDADTVDAQEVLDAFYAPIADAVLGPVDEADVWMHQKRTRTDRVAKRPDQTGNRKADPQSDCAEQMTPCAEPAPTAPQPIVAAFGLTTAPSDGDFAEWSRVSAPWNLPPIDARRAGEQRVHFASNTVSAAILDVIATHAANPVPDKALAGVINAAGRHASSFAAAAGRITTLADPKITDVDLTQCDDTDGILIVTDQSAAEQIGPGVIGGRRISRERPVAIMFRLRRSGLTALMIQVTGEEQIVYATWTSTPLRSDDDMEDAAWYMRGAVHEALAPTLRLTGDESEDVQVAALTMRPDLSAERRQGPRRVVAQARIRPERMAVAIGVIRRWFDETAAKHGDRLIEDRRREGEWTIEHQSPPSAPIASRWSVSVRMPQDNPGAIDIILRTTLATGVRPRLPALVREIAAATPTEGPDGRLLLEAPVVTNRTEWFELLKHLKSPERMLPTLIMTQDRYGRYMKDPQEVVLQSLGAMNVRLIQSDMTYEIVTTLGQEYRTFGGAVRLFHPRFDPEIDAPTRHPRFMMDVTGTRAMDDLIGRMTATTVTRYDIPDTPVHHAPEKPIEAKKETAKPSPAAIPAPEPDLDQLALVLPDDGADTKERTEEAPENTATAKKPSGQKESRKEVRKDVADGEGPTVEGPPETPVKVEKLEAKPAGAETRQTATPVVTEAEIDRLVEQGVVRSLRALGLDTLVSRMAELASTVDRMAIAIDQRLAAQGDPVALGERDATIAELHETLRAERISASQLLDEASANLSTSTTETARLRQALNARRRAAEDDAKPTWPKDLSGLSEWLDDNVLPNVVITSKAWRAMRQVRYTAMERLCRTLQLLDGAYVDMRAGEPGAKQRWDEGLKELRLESKKQSEMSKGIRGGSEYSFRHENEKWDIQVHLRGTESLYNDTDRLLRIYFSFDSEQKRVLIAHLPTHLTTIDS